MGRTIRPENNDRGIMPDRPVDAAGKAAVRASYARPKRFFFRLSISRTILLIFLAVILLSGAAIGIIGQWVQERSIHQLAAAESKRTAGLIFQHLYSVMRKGWTSQEVEDVISRINQTLPDVHVDIVRGEQVARQFGESAGNLNLRTTDGDLVMAFGDGQERLIAKGDVLRFLYPLAVKEECQTCHQDVAMGSINGIIDIHFPVSKLRLPLEFTLKTVVSIFLVVFLFLFALILLIVRQMIAKPILDLAGNIDGIVGSHDLGKRAEDRSFLWLNEVRSLTGNFNRLMEALQKSHDKLSRLSMTDPLTGLRNRRSYQERFEEEILRAERYGHELALIMIDLDGFKPVNDRFGHAVGDEVLTRVAEILTENVRGGDVAARLGGDEFAVLLPETGHEGAARLAGKLSGLIGEAVVESDGCQVSVGASAGIAVYPLDGSSVEAVEKCADDAMYRNKESRKVQS
jgi:diguanylate cyclase (GGDEF)-like protein